VLVARLDPEAGAVVAAALEAMGNAAGGSAEPRAVPREDPETLRADALVAMAEAARVLRSVPSGLSGPRASTSLRGVGGQGRVVEARRRGLR
jgi:hypothetical protein